MEITSIVSAFFSGLCDSFRGFIAVFYLENDTKRRRNRDSPLSGRGTKEQTPVRTSHKNAASTVKLKILQCCMLNGAISLSSIILFNYILLPMLYAFVMLLLAKHPSYGEAVWSFLEFVATFLFQTLWIVPLYAVCKIINNLWFQDIGQSAYRHSRGRSSNTLTLSKMLADFIFSSVVEILFLLQAEAVTYIQFYYLERLVYLVHLSLLYSLYAFEYKWVEMGWEIHRRLTSIETQWIYFLAFGMPLALVTQMCNQWMVKACIFSLLFPFYILGATEANPKTVDSIVPIKIFSPVIALSNTLFSLLGKQNKSTERNAHQARR